MPCCTRDCISAALHPPAAQDRTRTRARMEESSNGNLHIVGSFKTDVDPNFKLCLTSRVSAADFNMGYCMTGTLERGCKRTNSFQVTHFAVIRRLEVPTPTT
ncbi:hypothetical protein FOCC_FOCC004205 [Frankliniella occidentalis]|nr:hypothetical protein FOCC_FOCC004205 [Frankliniella occidentalis]